MLRIVSILLLIFLYTLSTCRVFVPFLHYAANKEYYLERCENKAKPELECGGNCQVKKEVAEAAHDTDQSSQSRTTPQSQRTNANETPELFHILTHTHEFSSPETGTASFLAFVNTALLFGVGTVPFQPPRS
jgi:hypothetical protein